ncbi:MAG: hypothetical protein ACRELV_09595 [Longimicrobiales bacterium]
MTSFGTYLVGFFIFVFGLAYAAYLLGAPPLWIGVGVIILLGLGVLMGTTRTKRPDPPEPPPTDRT